MPLVWIPSQLRGLTGGQVRVHSPGRTLGEVIDQLEAAYPGMRARLVAGDQVRESLAVLVGGEQRAGLLLEPVADDAEIHFVPAIAGG